MGREKRVLGAFVGFPNGGGDQMAEKRACEGDSGGDGVILRTK